MPRASTLTLTIRVSFEAIHPFSAASALLLTTWGSPGVYPFREMSTFLNDFSLFNAVKSLFLSFLVRHAERTLLDQVFSFIQYNSFVRSLLS